MNNGNGPSAPDIITYIGVPLAVLGVLPILYSFIRVIVVQRSIRSILKRHGLLDSAITRSSPMEGIVEVELPRCTITPLDRDIDPEYWKLNSHKVLLKGGSWTIFNWNSLITGKQLFRCQYKDELRIPEADVDFEELIAFLLDRGAVPDPKGWRMLKSIGLWTPTGTALLLPPRGISGTVLKVTAPSNADGLLSLQIDWKTEWDGRGSHSLPPFWVRLKQPSSEKILTNDKKLLTDSPTIEPKDQSTDENSSDDPKVRHMSRESTLVAEQKLENADTPPATLSILQIIEESKARVTTAHCDSIRFKLDGDHVQKVMFEDEGVATGESREIAGLGDTASVWFISAASALSQSLDCQLWNFTMPSHIAAVVKRRSIPCGVMVVLGMLNDSDVPLWASPPPSLNNTPEQMSERMRQESYERRLEDAMPPAQAAEARHIRLMRTAHNYHSENVARHRAMNDYQERRLIEAIQSPRLENNTVAEATLAYLIRENIIPSWYTILDLAHAVLYLMILNDAEMKLIADILERWALWSQFGGMQKVQLEVLMKNKVAFCYAAALVAVVEQGEAGDSNPSSDMLECLRLWKRIRLG